MFGYILGLVVFVFISICFLTREDPGQLKFDECV
jgi:hypothetical protein